ncbi:MAG: YvcK family protein [Peptococcaceae bacterium]|nr:YvcK family protein [Peptococcaceae bacterium]
MKWKRNVRGWFSPGLGLKRWAVLTGISIALIIIGLWSMVNNEHAKRWTISFVNFLQRSIPDLTIGQGLVCAVLGITAALISMRHFNDQYHKLSKNYMRLDAYYEDRRLANSAKIVVIGGGTGLSVLLKGLKHYTANLTAAVSVGDDGGSSGRLRDEFGVAPVGDVRSCIVALSDEEDIMEQLFNYRFSRGQGLKGHNLGNLLLLALTNISGSFQEAVSSTDQILHIRGRVLPITIQPLELKAELVDGSSVVGECNIGESELQIKHLSIYPPYAEVVPEVLEAIDEADAVILGPGSLYTSIMPNLCVHQVVDAIRESKCKTFYVCNVTTQPGETTDYTASDHLQAIYDHSCEEMIDYMLVDDGTIEPKVELADVLLQASTRVVVDHDKLDKMNTKVIETSLVNENNPYRHDSKKLAEAILETLYSDKDFKMRHGLVKSTLMARRFRQIEEEQH